MFGWLKKIFNASALAAAIKEGDSQRVKAILDSTPEVVTGKFGDNKGSALGYAASFRRTEIVRLLLGYVSARELDDSGMAAIHWASVADVTETVGILIDAGEDVNASDRYGMTPLHWAAIIGSAKMVEYLLQRGGDAKAVDRFGATVIH